MTRHTFMTPDARYHPGVNTRPTDGPVITAAEDASGATCLADPAVVFAWHYGLFLIDEHFFWEAHEVLEPVWMVALPNSRERHLVQGLIQLANACLKFEMGRPGAAVRLIDMAEAHVAEAREEAGDVLLGIDVDGCVAQVDRLRRAISEGQALIGLVDVQCTIM